MLNSKHGLNKIKSKLLLLGSQMKEKFQNLISNIRHSEKTFLPWHQSYVFARFYYIIFHVRTQMVKEIFCRRNSKNYKKERKFKWH